jgi:hypothetical protein
MLRATVNGVKIVRTAAQLITILLVFCLPVLPVFAQDQSATLPFGLVPVYTRQYNPSVEFSPTPVKLDLESQAPSPTFAVALLTF